MPSRAAAKTKKPAKAKAPKRKKPELILPRGYLSSSAADLWNSDKQRFREKYYFGGEDFTNDGMEFGKHVHAVIEGKAKPNDHVEENLKHMVIHYGNHEEELTAVLETEYGDITLLGKIDDFCYKTGKFVDYKTGSTVWTYEKARRLKQIRFYFLLVFLKTKKRASEAYVQWLETEKAEGPRYPYGRRLIGTVATFPVSFDTLADIEIRNYIIRTAREIDADYRQYLVT